MRIAHFFRKARRSAGWRAVVYEITGGIPITIAGSHVPVVLFVVYGYGVHVGFVVREEYEWVGDE